MANTELPWLVFGRKIRPFALAISIAIFTVFYAHVFGDEVGFVFDEGDLAGHILGGAAITSFTLLMLAWWGRNDAMMRYGLLIAAGVYFTRFAFFSLDLGWDSMAVWRSFAWAVGAAGAYLLEAVDDRYRRQGMSLDSEVRRARQQDKPLWRETGDG